MNSAGRMAVVGKTEKNVRRKVEGRGWKRLAGVSRIKVPGVDCSAHAFRTAAEYRMRDFWTSEAVSREEKEGGVVVDGSEPSGKGSDP